MRVAVPLFRGRVSPRYSIAREMVTAVVEEGECRDRETVPLGRPDDEDLIERLLELEIEVLICGGINRELVAQLTANGIEVIFNVAGEVGEILDALCRGELAPGYGLLTEPPPPPGPEVEEERGRARLPIVDCMECRERECLAGKPCLRPVEPGAVPALSVIERSFLDTGLEISREREPKLCRIAELVHFALTMGYRRIGLAFCRELFPEIEVLAKLLSRSFTVVPVCCRAGSAAAGDACQPALQAALLERAGTDLNVIAGLCMGCDVLFTARSHAPVTTLFVKDRTLAHNPMGAIYARYPLADVPRGTGRRAPEV